MDSLRWLRVVFFFFILVTRLIGIKIGKHDSVFVFPQGRFTIAAKHHITIAEIYETELVDIEKVSNGFTSS